MAETACPHCRGVMQCPPELAGKWVACPVCHQQFILPGQQLIAAAPPHYAYGTAQTFGQPLSGDWLSGVKVPILISGILNVLFSMIWTLALVSTCIGIILVPLVIPLVVLCVFEFIYYGSADTLPPRKAINDGRTIAICEIVAGVLSLNMFVLVCGVLALVNAGQAEQRLAAAGAY